MKSPNHRLFRGLSLFFAALLAVHGAADYTTPYLFSTLAGTSSIGSQDGAGAAARFYSPRAVATDAAGNAFIVDQGNHTIRKITTAGLVTTLAGTPGIAGNADGTGAAARFDDPRDIGADAAGNLYVIDAGNHTIRKVTPAGVVTTFAGLAGVTGSQDGAGSSARFNRLSGLAIDSSGTLYVTDVGNHAIRKITSTGTVTTFASVNFAEIRGDLNLTYGAIAVDGAGAVYATRHVGGDTVTHQPGGWGDNYTIFAGSVTRYTPDGTAADLWPTSYTRYFDGRIGNAHVSDLAFDLTGQLVAAVGPRIVRHSFTTGTRTPVAGDGALGGSDGSAGTARCPAGPRPRSQRHALRG
jgi:sugar lactone lactonase YvrE